ncbi:hypothetical protein V6N11_039851 [Hibiscus sabdariffa]|uniref:WAT1-related protein n=1 Tax=Hibiscus sabdariffa TaxID=183260 RepID=A0ABR2RG81_9ROSI
MDTKKPYLAIILIQSIYAGMFLLSKAAFDGGMNNFVFVFYRQAAATVFLVPLALFVEWKSLPPLSFVTFCKIFLLSLFGITLSLDINGLALVYTSATLGAATTNCLPVITFFLALLLGMEALRLKTSAGIAKLTGILTCMAGVLTLAFFKGPHFKLFCLHHLFRSHHSQTLDAATSSSLTWVKGCFLMLISVTFWALWLVLQGPVLKSYPSKLLFTALQCFLTSFQSFGIAIALGVVVTGVTYYLQSWVIEKKGPVFLAMSTPLNLVFTMLCSAFLLCEFTSLGSVVGGLLLIIGLYSVLWGKTKEQKLLDEKCLSAGVNKQGTELT